MGSESDDEPEIVDDSDDDSISEKDVPRSDANVFYVEQLAKFHKQQGQDLNRFATLNDRPIDFYRLKKSVERRGGFGEVCYRDEWAEVGRELGHSTGTLLSISITLRNFYQKWILPYEQYLELARQGGDEESNYRDSLAATPQDIIAALPDKSDGSEVFVPGIGVDDSHLCLYPGCERGIPGNGFPRRYNLFDHMRRVHNHQDDSLAITGTESTPKEPAEPEEDSLTASAQPAEGMHLTKEVFGASAGDIIQVRQMLRENDPAAYHQFNNDLRQYSGGAITIDQIASPVRASLGHRAELMLRRALVARTELMLRRALLAMSRDPVFRDSAQMQDFESAQAQTPISDVIEPAHEHQGAVDASVASEDAHQRPTSVEGSLSSDYNVGYVCVECMGLDDGTGLKWWPRLENFKEHVRRKHPYADLDLVIQA